MKHSVVIGGTGGTGKVVARLLADSGHHVSVVGRSAPPAETYHTDRIHYSSCDITTDACDEVIRWIVKRHGPISSAVFLQRYRADGDRWSGEIETVIGATKRIIEALREQFDMRHNPSIVVVSSIAGQLIADEQDLAYHVAKAGVEQLVRYYAVLLGRRGVRVNAVAPAGILKDENRQFFETNPEIMALHARAIPLGRIATAEEVARVVLFLCSDQASYVTGQIITLDGGASLQAPESLARRLAGVDPS